MPWEESDIETGSDHPTARQENESFAASIGLEVVGGSAEFIADVDALLEEYPADLPPLDVEIDTAKWHAPKNQGPAHNQSVEGQQEVRRYIESYWTVVRFPR